MARKIYQTARKKKMIQINNGAKMISLRMAKITSKVFLTSKHHAKNWSHSTVEQYAIIPAPFKANIKSL